MDKQQYIIISDDTDAKVETPTLSHKDEEIIANIIESAIEEVRYGADKCGANLNEQAAKN